MRTLSVPQGFPEGIRYLQKINNNEYSSTCPNPTCPDGGGQVHQNGELPDRFRIWLRSDTTGGLAGWCRVCGYFWTPQGTRLDPETHKKWIDERKDIEIAKKQKIEYALSLLQREQMWVQYHENLVNGEELKERYLYPRMLKDSMIDYWMLGYNPYRKVYTKQGEYTTPSLTIPVFNYNAEVVNVRNRLLNPINPSDKYRPEVSGLPATLYYTDIYNKPQGEVLIVEGEFKAMTTYVTIEDADMFVVGVPGKSPSAEILSELDECDTVYLCLDPDAFQKDASGKSAVGRMIELLGRSRCRVISLPYKIDDMITSGYLDAESLKNLIRDSRRIR